jgi:hypothetical protein
MQSPAVMMSDIKALLTLWLLKTGTTPAEIRTSLQLTATSRAIAADEHSAARPETVQLAPAGNLNSAGNIARLYPNSEAEIAARKAQLSVEAMNADVMTLITLSLLKIGTSSDEIQKALRLAALSRAPGKEEHGRGALSGAMADLPESLGGGAASTASKQAALNDLLVPGFSHGLALA